MKKHIPLIEFLSCHFLLIEKNIHSKYSAICNQNNLQLIMNLTKIRSLMQIENMISVENILHYIERYIQRSFFQVMIATCSPFIFFVK